MGYFNVDQNLILLLQLEASCFINNEMSVIFFFAFIFNNIGIELER